MGYSIWSADVLPLHPDVLTDGAYMAPVLTDRKQGGKCWAEVDDVSSSDQALPGTPTVTFFEGWGAVD